MKKAFDQTVRDLKREVNKKVLKVPGVEQKVLDATSNEPWGPHGSHLSDIAQATRNYHEYQMIMNVIWKRISDTGKNWRHVYKGLTVLEYLVAHGSERVIDEIKEHAYQISALSNFQYIDSSGRDQGSNVRKKSQSLVNLVNDKERIQELRQKAQANREKYRSSISTGKGGYGDRYDDDRYGRDEDRYGYGRDRESAYRDDDRYGRNGDSYGREGDRYNRDSDERYGKDNDRDDDYKGSRGNDDYGSKNGNLNRDRSFDEDDHYSSRSGGGRIDDSQDERKFEHRLSASGGAPPSYEEAARDAHNLEQEARDGGNVSGASPKASSVAGVSHIASSAAGASPKASAAVPSPVVASPGATSESTNAAPVTAADDVPAPASFKTSGFDEFDPRGSVSAAAPAATTLEMDLFGSSLDPLYSLALVPVDSMPANTEANVPASSSFGTDFGNLQHGENPFGDPPFKAIPESFQAQQESFAPNTSFQPSISTGAPENPAPAARTLESATSFDFGGSFGGLSFTSTSLSDQQGPVANSAVLSHEVNLTPANDDFTSLLAPQAGSAFFTPPVVQPTASLHTAGIPHQQPGPHAPFGPQVYQFTPQQPAAPVHGAGIAPQAGYQAQFAPQFSQFAPQQPAAPAYLAGTPPQQAGLQAPFSHVSQFTQQQATAPVHTAGIPQQTGLQAPFAPQVSQFTPQAAQGTPASQVTSQAAYPTANIQHAQVNQMNLLSQPGLPAPLSREAAAPVSTMLSAKSSSNDKFETKSSVWTDTLNRGLVNLNISGPKINPHADIGIDFESMNRKEKRTEDKKGSAAPVTFTINMGKAMGSGSGIGRAGAGGLARPSNPTMGSGMGMSMGGNPGMGMGMGGNPGMGMGMGGNPGMGMAGYGGSMNQPMGMGMGMNQPIGMNMGMGMGMNMGMNQGMPMRPPMGMSPGGPGMPGTGYNPMPGYGSQQPYGGGYR